jgi:hypothetical protein
MLRCEVEPTLPLWKAGERREMLAEMSKRRVQLTSWKTGSRVEVNEWSKARCRSDEGRWSGRDDYVVLMGSGVVD